MYIKLPFVIKKSTGLIKVTYWIKESSNKFQLGALKYLP
jgi:hypothetical protein